VSLEGWISCHECDLVHRVPRVSGTHTAKCTRCGATLYQARTNGLERTLALTVTGLILFVLANAFPLMTFEMAGRSRENSLISGAVEFWNAGFPDLAVLVFATSVALPLVSLLSMAYVLLPLALGMRSWHVAPVFRLASALRPWAMMEVFMLGVFVAVVKLASFAELSMGPGLYCFCALIVVTAAAAWMLDAHDVWRRLDALGSAPAETHSPEAEPAIGCHSCGLLVPRMVVREHARPRCRRCGSSIHHRKPNSLTRAWAYLIAALILYFPANYFPIMTVVMFGRGEPDTILSGVIHLLEAGEYPIAAIVFFASVFVPILKIVMLAFLLLSVRFKSRWRPRDRTMMYRITENVGRWSMIDIFMISILVGLVKLGAVATVEAGIGATAFAGVVILTMMAAMNFDSRLIWDKAEDSDE
jgi:paraquat-inducible protein A